MYKHQCVLPFTISCLMHDRKPPNSELANPRAAVHYNVALVVLRRRAGKHLKTVKNTRDAILFFIPAANNICIRKEMHTYTRHAAATHVSCGPGAFKRILRNYCLDGPGLHAGGSRVCDREAGAAGARHGQLRPLGLLCEAAIEPPAPLQVRVFGT